MRPLNIDDVDSIIKDFHAELGTPILKPVNKDIDGGNIDISNGHVSKKAKVTKWNHDISHTYFKNIHIIGIINCWVLSVSNQ